MPALHNRDNLQCDREPRDLQTTMRAPVPLGLGSRISKPNFASTYVTISRRASSGVRKRSESNISSSSDTNASRPTSWTSSSKLSLQLFLVTCRVGFPVFNTSLEFQQRAPSWRNDRAKQGFAFLHPVVGSYRFCSLREDSNGFFCELATMSLASKLVRAKSPVRICCNTNSK